MKRLVFLVLIASVFAQSAAWADDDYVLEQARKRANSSRRQSGAEAGKGAAASEAADTDAAVIDLPYTPILLAFTPGLSIPFGMYDTSVALGIIGSMTGNITGAQLSSVFNITMGKVAGAQGAGVFNIVDQGVSGAQGAGVFNITGGTVGYAQGAGVFNIAGDVNGAQGAGVFNISKAVRGLQSAGVFNIAESISGVQAAGVFNIATSMDGVMVAGLFNVVGHGRGVMIGVVNIADKLDGVALGLVNIIGNGVHDFSLDYQFETRTAYLGYRTGTNAVYASFYGGLPVADIPNKIDNLTVGVGIGHRQTLAPLSLDIELCAETPVNSATFERWNASSSFNTVGCAMNLAALPFFGSFRATFGLGGKGGFGAYVGLKADFEWRGAGLVPSHLRTGSAGALDVFGASFDYWPKFFVGVRL
ncbi:MAG: hypothetical protein WCT14_21730 [Treponemataceae bacterium]